MLEELHHVPLPVPKNICYHTGQHNKQNNSLKTASSVTVADKHLDT